MTLRDINRRLDQLDARHPAETPRRYIRLIVAADEGETQDEAIACWCAEHPDEPPPVDDDNTLIIMHTLVAPK
jgi:hypothetical protein